MKWLPAKEPTGYLAKHQAESSGSAHRPVLTHINTLVNINAMLWVLLQGRTILPAPTFKHAAVNDNSRASTKAS
jgi:hypothetical protein